MKRLLVMALKHDSTTSIHETEIVSCVIGQLSLPFCSRSVVRSF